MDNLKYNSKQFTKKRPIDIDMTHRYHSQLRDKQK